MGQLLSVPEACNVAYMCREPRKAWHVREHLAHEQLCTHQIISSWPARAGWGCPIGFGQQQIITATQQARRAHQTTHRYGWRKRACRGLARARPPFAISFHKRAGEEGSRLGLTTWLWTTAEQPVQAGGSGGGSRCPSKRSNARPRLRMSPSCPCGATNCAPTGSPSVDKPTGIDKAAHKATFGYVSHGLNNASAHLALCSATDCAAHECPNVWYAPIPAVSAEEHATLPNYSARSHSQQKAEA